MKKISLRILFVAQIAVCIAILFSSCGRSGSHISLSTLRAERDSIQRTDSVRQEAALKVLQDWQAGAVVDTSVLHIYGIDSCFVAYPISDEVFARMEGVSYSKGCPVSREKLRYLHLLHHNKEGRIQLGEMVVHQDIANDIVDIFRTLYDSAYMIERMVLIDDYNADDNVSMQANNTCAFCHRRATGYQLRLSKHSYGMAIDLNPLYNPYVSSRHIYPKEAEPYAVGRTADRWERLNLQPNDSAQIIQQMLLTRNSLPCRLFRAKGFQWGGTWRRTKDYQHFEK